MAKKKDAAALFEVIAQTKERQIETQANLPEWAGKQQAGQPTSRPAPAPSPPKPPSGASPSPAQAPGSGRLGRPAAPQAQRVEMSLSYSALALLGVGFAVLMVASFVLGRATAPTGATGGGPSAATPPPKEKVPGRFYLIVETVRGDSADATALLAEMKAFLARQDPKIYADVYKHPKDRTVHYLIARRAFDPPEGVADPKAPDSSEAAAFARRVDELGEKFRRTPVGRRYSYDFNKFTNGRLDLETCYLRWPAPRRSGS